MLRYAIVFLVVALVAAALGFGGLAGSASWLAQACFVLFLVLALVSFASRALQGKSVG